MRNRPRLRLADEIRYIQRRAAARDGRVVTADPGSYRLDGQAFVYTDRHSRRVSTILGYPTQPLTKNIRFRKLVDITKLRWRIERDYQELKQEVGLGHFEGRGWRGFHHHATLCIAAYGFLVSERETIPPSGPR